MKLMKNMMSNFLDRPHLRVHQHIGLFVSSLPLRQQFANFCHGISVSQQRTMTLVMHSIPYGLRRSPKTNDERVPLQVLEMDFIGAQATPGGNYHLLRLAQFLNDLGFDVSEGCFTGLGENLGNRPARARFNEFIRVHKLETELTGYKTSHGGFSCPHEADQGEVLNLARPSHDVVI